MNESTTPFEESKFYVGASLSGLTLNYSKASEWSFGLSAKAGYLFLDNWMVLGVFDYQNYSSGYAVTTNIGAGVRYFFERNGIFVGLTPKYSHQPGIDEFKPEVNVGYAFFLGHYVTLEPELYYDIHSSACVWASVCTSKHQRLNIKDYIVMLSVDELVDRLIDLSFAEDIGDGDHTTLCCIPEDAMGKSHLLIKEDGILAGVEIAKEGDIAMVVTGKIRSLLQTERLMLNIMQRMSGIATMTDRYVQRLKGTNTRVLDTRKTTPGMRMLEKQAVKIGGGCNHRIGLFDMILLKDNHVDFAGGITNAIDRCHIEVRSFDELQQVLDHGGVNRIMLDNFSVPDTKKAVDIIGGRYETESSGGITYDTIRDYAEQGVDFISVGALTHSVKGLDMSFKAC